MSDDDFEDILDEVYHYFPHIATDRYALTEYARAVASVNNTGGEEQRAQLQDLIDELTIQQEDERAEQATDAEEA